MDLLVKLCSALGNSTQPPGRELHQKAASSAVVKSVGMCEARWGKYKTQRSAFPTRPPDLLCKTSLHDKEKRSAFVRVSWNHKSRRMNRGRQIAPSNISFQ